MLRHAADLAARAVALIGTPAEAPLSEAERVAMLEQAARIGSAAARAKLAELARRDRSMAGHWRDPASLAYGRIEHAERIAARMKRKGS